MAPAGSLGGTWALSVLGVRAPVGVRWTAPHSAHVSITVYDVRGRRIRALYDADPGAGANELSWNGLDTRGVSVPRGIYVLQLRSGAVVRRHKFVVTP